MSEQSDRAIRVGSYNIRKAIGLDRRRDPARILAVLGEFGADIVALQEADRRFGARESALPLPLIEAAGYKIVDFDIRPYSIGWHGNALLVRPDIAIIRQQALTLPTLEPRGAIMAELGIGARRLIVVGMHLDLSGLWRRKQANAILDIIRREAPDVPHVLMGDLNEWSTGGCLNDFGEEHQVLRPGRSFHSRRPLGELDRIVVSPSINCAACGVHRSGLAAIASDHLPVWADLIVPQTAHPLPEIRFNP